MGDQRLLSWLKKLSQNGSSTRSMQNLWTKKVKPGFWGSTDVSVDPQTEVGPRHSMRFVFPSISDTCGQSGPGLTRLRRIVSKIPSFESKLRRGRRNAGVEGHFSPRNTLVMGNPFHSLNMYAASGEKAGPIYSSRVPISPLFTTCHRRCKPVLSDQYDFKQNPSLV